VSETVRLILTKFTDETITVFSTLLLMTMAIIVAYWFYNRKKFHQLSHEIPASVVKNYLDSIIQNSTALKSSLFRGGGLDIGNGIPSVVPIHDLPSGNVSVGSSSEEVSQKNAEIQSLSIKLNDKSRQVTDLEKKVQDLISSSGNGSAESEMLKQEVQSLQVKLQEAQAAGAGNEELVAELETLRERLKEYEIIEEDLANLKRLQQENDQLKAELAALKKGGAAPAAPAPAAPAPAAPAPTPEPQKAATPAAEPKSVEVKDGPEVKVENEQKSAEELLQEFEKMLG
jgi:myosin heavy subunit